MEGSKTATTTREGAAGRAEGERTTTRAEEAGREQQQLGMPSRGSNQ